MCSPSSVSCLSLEAKKKASDELNGTNTNYKYRLAFTRQGSMSFSLSLSHSLIRWFSFSCEWAFQPHDFFVVFHVINNATSRTKVISKVPLTPLRRLDQEEPGLEFSRWLRFLHVNVSHSCRLFVRFYDCDVIGTMEKSFAMLSWRIDENGFQGDDVTAGDSKRHCRGQQSDEEFEFILE